MNRQELPEKLNEKYDHSETLDSTRYLLDQPFFEKLRTDTSTLLPPDLFLDPKRSWIIFVHLAAGPRWGISPHDPQAKDTLNGVRRENMDVFNPGYTTEAIVTIGFHFHNYLEKNHKYCIPYLQKYQRYFSWKKEPRHLPYVTTPVPTYEAFCRRMAEVEAAMI